MIDNRGRPYSAEPSTDTFAGALAVILREHRVSLGYTIEEASRRTGGVVLPQTISSMELGKHSIKLRDFLALCMAYGARPTAILPQRVANELRGKKQKTWMIAALLSKE